MAKRMAVVIEPGAGVSPLPFDLAKHEPHSAEWSVYDSHAPGASL
jgi:hypothetical protein